MTAGLHEPFIHRLQAIRSSRAFSTLKQLRIHPYWATWGLAGQLLGLLAWGVLGLAGSFIGFAFYELVSAKNAGEPNQIERIFGNKKKLSLKFRVRNVHLHLHHWLTCLVLLVLIVVFRPGMISGAWMSLACGLCVGGIFQGLRYEDRLKVIWYEVTCTANQSDPTGKIRTQTSSVFVFQTYNSTSHEELMNPLMSNSAYLAHFSELEQDSNSDELVAASVDLCSFEYLSALFKEPEEEDLNEAQFVFEPEENDEAEAEGDNDEFSEMLTSFLSEDLD